MPKLSRDGTEIEEVSEPEGWTDEDRKRTREATGEDLPVLIDTTGWYVTRAGARAYVDKIKDRSKATANCIGTIYTVTRNRAGVSKETREFSTWQENGRWKFLGECPRDIIKKA